MKDSRSVGDIGLRPGFVRQYILPIPLIAPELLREKARCPGSVDRQYGQQPDDQLNHRVGSRARLQAQRGTRRGSARLPGRVCVSPMCSKRSGIIYGGRPA